jgi:DNA-binding beta-propeller fold protein YncE
VSIVDAHSLAEVARIAMSKPLPHGVAYAPDGSVAFVSAESVGADSGAVDVIDLASRPPRRVATIAIPRQPTGIAVLVQP